VDGQVLHLLNILGGDGNATAKDFEKDVRSASLVFSRRAAEAVTKGEIYKDGKNLSKRVWSNAARAGNDVQQIVTQGLASGMSAVDMAKMLEPRIGKLDTFKSLLMPVLYVGIPILLVFLQPDLGTSLVYIAIFVGMLFISGIKTKLIKIIASVTLLLMPLGWFVLKEYQKQRILVFLNPDIDPFGSGYHIIQSKIAIGSGLIFGKGIFNGTQSQLNFLPENHTDFIFSVIGEEFGFVGCIIVLFLLFMLIYRSIKVAYMCNDNFGMLLATGIATMFTFEVLVNVGMTIGIMPVTGIPLPFLSYGVSALTTNMLSIGILLNILIVIVL